MEAHPGLGGSVKGLLRGERTGVKIHQVIHVTDLHGPEQGLQNPLLVIQSIELVARAMPLSPGSDKTGLDSHDHIPVPGIHHRWA